MSCVEGWRETRVRAVQTAQSNPRGRCPSACVCDKSQLLSRDHTIDTIHYKFKVTSRSERQKRREGVKKNMISVRRESQRWTSQRACSKTFSSSS